MCEIELSNGVAYSVKMGNHKFHEKYMRNYKKIISDIEDLENSSVIKHLFPVVNFDLSKDYIR